MAQKSIPYKKLNQTSHVPKPIDPTVILPSLYVVVINRFWFIPPMFVFAKIMQ